MSNTYARRTIIILVMPFVLCVYVFIGVIAAFKDFHENFLKPCWNVDSSNSNTSNTEK